MGSTVPHIHSPEVDGRCPTCGVALDASGREVAPVPPAATTDFVFVATPRPAGPWDQNEPAS